MSYILDALRKADAQRSRGSVPDLRAQPLGEPAGGDAPPARRWGLWAGAALLLVAGGALLGWALLGRPPVATATAEAPPDAVPPVARAQPVEAPPAAAAPRPVPAEAPAPPIGEVRLLLPPRPAAAPNPPAAVSAATVAPAPAAAMPAPAGTAPPGPAATTAAIPATAAPSAPAPRLAKLAELPPELRALVPTLNIGGAMHSQNAAQRMLIVNGQLYREGDQPAPGVVLERIQLKSAVLSVRGTRFEIAY